MTTLTTWHRAVSATLPRTPARTLALSLAAILVAGATWANCTPPHSTLFYCNIQNSDARVEFCRGPGDENDISDFYSYNFSRGTAPAELYFEDDGYGFDLRYYKSDRHDANNTAGISLTRGDHVYSFYVTGLYRTGIRAAQIHVHDLASYQTGKPDTEKLRLYCDPGSVLIDWDAMRP